MLVIYKTKLKIIKRKNEKDRQKKKVVVARRKFVSAELRPVDLAPIGARSTGRTPKWEFDGRSTMSIGHGLTSHYWKMSVVLFSGKMPDISVGSVLNNINMSSTDQLVRT